MSITIESLDSRESHSGITILRWLPIISLAGLCGCSGPALRHAYADYSQVYADSVNRQLLLNLARVSRDEPPYFVQLGQINSQFTFNTSIGFTPSYARVRKPNGQDTVQYSSSFGGSVSAGAVESPTFQFVPLNGEAFGQAINAPISDKLFYGLYDQGFHADTLLRTMVASVRVPDEKRSAMISPSEIKDVAGLVKKLKQRSDPVSVFLFDNLSDATRQTLNNIPDSEIALEPAAIQIATNLNSIIQDNLIYEPKRFAKIKLKDETRQILLNHLQGRELVSVSYLNRLLLEDIFPSELSKHSLKFKVYVNHPYSETYPDFLRLCKALRTSQLNHTVTVRPVASGDPATVYRDVKLKDAVTAISAGFSVTNLVATNAAPASAADTTNFVVSASRKSFRLEPVDVLDLEGFAPEAKQALIQHNVEFQMRTFVATMYGVAREEYYFKVKGAKNSHNSGKSIPITYDSSGENAALGSTDEIQSFNVQPILKLTSYSDAERAQLAKVVELRYKGSTYVIGDRENDTSDTGTKNRSVFAVLSYLFASISIDPQKLPVQQLIQVH